jgi:hypothetical protein
MLSYYQQTELIVGTFLFLILYAIMIKLNGNFSITNLLITTVLFGVLLLSYLYIITLYYEYRLQE